MAQHAQHGAVVQVAGCKAARGQGHGHGAEQGGQQGHEIQKLFCTVERAAHLGAAAFKRLHAHAAHRSVSARFFYLCLCPLHKGFHGRVVPRHGQAVGEAAGGLHEFGGSQILRIEHHTRGKVHEARATVGLVDDDAGNAQLRIAQEQHVAHLQGQHLQQRRIDPGLAHGRHIARGTFGLAGGVGHFEAAAQGVAGGHGFERHEFARAALRVTGAAHGGEAQGAGGLQAQLSCLGAERGRRQVVGDDDRVTT